MNTGTIIAKLAKERGKNIHQLAVEAGVPYNTLYAIVKRDSAKVNSDIIHRVATVLEVPDYALLSGNDGKVVDSEKTPQELRNELREEALLQIAFISFLFTAERYGYSDLPDEYRGPIAGALRRLRAHAEILCAKNPLTEDDVSDYRTEQYAQPYQLRIAKPGMKASQSYGDWLQHISKFICRYASLNPTGRKELEKRLGELERLGEYEDEILTAEVKKIVEETFKWD